MRLSSSHIQAAAFYRHDDWVLSAGGHLVTLSDQSIVRLISLQPRQLSQFPNRLELGAPKVDLIDNLDVGSNGWHRPRCKMHRPLRSRK